MLNLNQYIANTEQHIKVITTNELRSLQRKDDIIIDVREPNELDAGMIEGAIGIPRGVLEMQLLQHPSVKNKQTSTPLHRRNIYLYCRSGARSALAAFSLQSMGFENVFSVSGGYQAWCAHSH